MNGGRHHLDNRGEPLRCPACNSRLVELDRERRAGALHPLPADEQPRLPPAAAYPGDAASHAGG